MVSLHEHRGAGINVTKMLGRPTEILGISRRLRSHDTCRDPTSDAYLFEADNSIEALGSTPHAATDDLTARPIGEDNIYTVVDAVHIDSNASLAPNSPNATSAPPTGINASKRDASAAGLEDCMTLSHDAPYLLPPYKTARARVSGSAESNIHPARLTFDESNFALAPVMSTDNAHAGLAVGKGLTDPVLLGADTYRPHAVETTGVTGDVGEEDLNLMVDSNLTGSLEDGLLEPPLAYATHKSEIKGCNPPDGPVVEFLPWLSRTTILEENTATDRHKAALFDYFGGGSKDPSATYRMTGNIEVAVKELPAPDSSSTLDVSQEPFNGLACRNAAKGCSYRRPAPQTTPGDRKLLWQHERYCTADSLANRAARKYVASCDAIGCAYSTTQKSERKAKQAMRHHMSVKHNPNIEMFTCDVQVGRRKPCDQQFKGYSSLVSHNRVCHSPACVPQKCPFVGCDRCDMLQTEIQVTKHLRGTHRLHGEMVGKVRSAVMACTKPEGLQLHEQEDSDNITLAVVREIS